MRCVIAVLSLALICAFAGTEGASASEQTPAQTHRNLNNSPGAFASARKVAEEHALQFFVTPAEVLKSVKEGHLIGLPKDKHFIFTGSFPYALPEIMEFVEARAVLQERVCGKKLIVTSLVRAKVKQPKNAAPNSLHRTGMAIDFHIPEDKCGLNLLEGDLKDFEKHNILHAWKATDPAHYHVAYNLSVELPDEVVNEIPLEEEPPPPPTVVVVKTLSLGETLEPYISSASERLNDFLETTRKLVPRNSVEWSKLALLLFIIGCSIKLLRNLTSLRSDPDPR